MQQGGVMTAHITTTPTSRYKRTRKPVVKPVSATKPLAVLDVLPHEQPHVTLGTFSLEDLNRGFVVDFSQCSNPLAPVSQIIPIETSQPGRYKLVLQVANYGDEPFRASVVPLRLTV
jgi:hypothetical protein